VRGVDLVEEEGSVVALLFCACKSVLLRGVNRTDQKETRMETKSLELVLALYNALNVTMLHIGCFQTHFFE